VRFQRTLVDAGVLAGYALAAFLLLGLPLLLEPGKQFLGWGNDPLIPIWAFAWFPHAILHGENPLFTHAVWAPEGANLTWTTVVPGLALAFAPLTLAIGAIDSYTVAEALLPAFAAWTAYLLCRYVTRTLWPSVVGGLLFGFSTYVFAQGEAGHTQLAATFLLPLAALVLLRFLDGGISGLRLVVELGVVLALQVLLSTEFTFTLTLAIAAGLVLALLLVPARRRGIKTLVPYLAGAYLLAGVLTAPFLYYALTGYHSAFNESSAPGVDLLNFVIPTPTTLAFGGAFSGISGRFPGNVAERDAYLGVPTLLLIALFARERYRTAAGRYLLVAAAVAFVGALGAQASVGGHLTIDMPWMLLHSLPFFDNVLTGRFAAYLALLASVIVALWMSVRSSGILRWLLPLLALAAIVPDPRPHAFATTYEPSPFYTDAAYRGCLAPGETVLVIPEPEQIFDQVLTDFRFRLAGGYVGPGATPRSYLDPPSFYSIAIGETVSPEQLDQLRSFVAAKHVTSIVIEHWDYPRFGPTLNMLAKPQRAGGVIVYRLSGPARRCPA
jgi:hypothetical protein